MDNTIIITEEGSIDNYVSEYDIAVCGYGGAGGSAAIEAANNNSQVILFERASDGGGSTALSVVRCIWEALEVLLFKMPVVLRILVQI